jgi:hypothetical protein
MTRHHVPVLAEVDVTLARAAIAKLNEATGEGLSRTGRLIKCLAQAASEHQRVHALRLGRRKPVLFDEVDVAVVVQRRLEGTDPPEHLPAPHVIRKASEETVEAIHAEIRAAQRDGPRREESSRGSVPDKRLRKIGPRKRLSRTIKGATGLLKPAALRCSAWGASLRWCPRSS